MATEVLILKDDPSNTGQIAQFAKRNADGGLEVHVSGGTVTATGGLTDTQLRATPVPVSGTVTANINGLPSTATSQGPVTTTQTKVPATNLANRKALCIKALAANAGAIYIGLTGVSATADGPTGGFELSAGDSVDVDPDPTIQYYAITASGTQRWCTLELA